LTGFPRLLASRNFRLGLYDHKESATMSRRRGKPAFAKVWGGPNQPISSPALGLDPGVEQLVRYWYRSALLASLSVLI